MELINTKNENSFDPTPKLKSSPIPILFILLIRIKINVVIVIINTPKHLYFIKNIAKIVYFGILRI